MNDGANGAVGSSLWKRAQAVVGVESSTVDPGIGAVAKETSMRETLSYYQDNVGGGALAK